MNTLLQVMLAKFYIQRPSGEHRFNPAESELSSFTAFCFIRLAAKDLTLRHSELTLCIIQDLD
jgi:hypothetical protein